MKTVLFTDLDDTLFSTARKQPIDERFALASTLKDGEASGYQSPTQQAFWALWTANDALVIPVTARNRDAFSRVHLPFADVAIVNHGGMILTPDRDIERDWHTTQLAQAEASLPWLQTQQTRLATLADEMQLDIRMKINRDADLSLYVLLKSNTDDDAGVSQLARRYQQTYPLSGEGYVHCNSNNLAILPRWLSKASAVDYVKAQLRQRYGDLLTLGCGDSISDLGFMHCCDFWLAPQASQITQQSRLSFTNHSGESR